MSVAQSDSLVGPITAQLVLIAQQIEGVGRTYDKVPEGAPEDNSVMFPCRHIGVEAGTNGRLDLTFEFDIIHCFRRGRLQEALDRCYSVMPAWLTVLSGMQNVRMNGVAKFLDVSDMDIKEVEHGGQKMIGVVSKVRVLKEFTIPA